MNKNLRDLIYFRNLLISVRTKHLTHKQLIDRIKKRPNLISYLDDFTENNPNIYHELKETVEEKIDNLCNHDIVDDVVEECSEMY